MMGLILRTWRWNVSCWETLGSAIYVDATQTLWPQHTFNKLSNKQAKNYFGTPQGKEQSFGFQRPPVPSNATPGYDESNPVPEVYHLVIHRTQKISCPSSHARHQSTLSEAQHPCPDELKLFFSEQSGPRKYGQMLNLISVQFS